MTTEYTYNPAPKLTRMERFTAFCRDKWGVDADEVVFAGLAAFIVSAVLIGMAIVQL